MYNPKKMYLSDSVRNKAFSLLLGVSFSASSGYVRELNTRKITTTFVFIDSDKTGHSTILLKALASCGINILFFYSEYS